MTPELQEEIAAIAAPFLRPAALALGADKIIADAIALIIAREVAAARPLIVEQCARVAETIVSCRADDDWWDGYCGAMRDIAAAIREQVK